ncbi:unnamed protein product [Musa textilis]
MVFFIFQLFDKMLSWLLLISRMSCCRCDDDYALCLKCFVILMLMIIYSRGWKANLQEHVSSSNCLTKCFFGRCFLVLLPNLIISMSWCCFLSEMLLLIDPFVLMLISVRLVN